MHSMSMWVPMVKFPIVEDVINAYGGVRGVQSRFGYKEPMAVYNWRSRGLPRSLVAEIYVDTGIDMSLLLGCASGLSRKPEAI